MTKRFEEADEFSTGYTLGILRRALRYCWPVRWELTGKLAFLCTGFVAMTFMPWPVRILFDHVIGDTPLDQSVTPFPFFIRPFTDMMMGASRTELLIATLLFQALLLLIVGAFGAGLNERDANTSWLARGWDTATRTENQINSGYSEIGGLIGLIDVRWSMRLHQKLSHLYRIGLFERIQSLPMTTFDDTRIGDAVYRVMYDTAVISSMCTLVVFTPIGSAIHILMEMYVIGLVYGWGSPLVPVGLLGIVVAFLPTLPLAALQRRYSGAARKAGATTTSTMEESMNNMVAVQSLGGETRERNRFDKDSSDSFRQFRYRTLIQFIFYFVTITFGVALSIWVLIYIGDRIIEGTLSVGDMTVLSTSFITIVISSYNIGAMWMRTQEYATGINRVFFLFDAAPETDLPNAKPLPPIKESVNLEKVIFSYEEGIPVLQNINFEARLGQITAFVGPVGAGKTTIASMIPRFIQPNSGRVIVDGVDIAAVTKESLRSQIAYVFQETILFDATIEENIKLGNPGATELEIHRAAQMAGADEFIQKLPDGYQTRLGRAGGKLSVGQKQRLSIARALVRDAKILILDEPTSALDPETERRLINTLKNVSHTSIVLIIAHRLSTIREADQILFIDKGQILELGSHSELMVRPEGAYRRFVELQTLGIDREKE